jgi:TonB family protein
MGTLLDNKPDKQDLDKQKEQITVVLRDSEEKFPLEKALALSAFLHPFIPFILWLAIFILAFFGLHIDLFKKPEIVQNKDIEFILTNNNKPPINKNTRFRSDRNSRAGGKHDPTKRIREPESVSKPSTPSKSAPSRQNAPQQKAQRPSPKPFTMPRLIPRPANVPPRPTAKNIQPAPPRLSRPNPFSVPVPKVKAPRAVAPTGGPVTSGPVGAYSPSGDPSPSMSGGRSGRSRGSRGSGYSSGHGDPGNPGPGNENGAAGVDALREPDFGPFMLELKRRIKRNWHPPRGNESKKVVLLFRVAKDGRLVGLNVKRSSGAPEADAAAMQAVRMSAPFRPLPPECRESSVSIEFSFEYNVVGGDLSY